MIPAIPHIRKCNGLWRVVRASWHEGRNHDAWQYCRRMNTLPPYK